MYYFITRENTDMIRLYSQLDTRFATLGYIVKHFAKVSVFYMLNFRDILIF